MSSRRSGFSKTRIRGCRRWREEVSRKRKQLRDQAVRNAPEDTPAGTRQIDGGKEAFRVVDPEAAPMVSSGVGEFAKSHPESLFHFVVRMKPARGSDAVDETRHEDGEGGAGDVVQASEVLGAPEIQADFLSRLALCGKARARVEAVDPPAGERDVARPRIVIALRPLDKEKLNRFLLLMQYHCDGGADPVS